MAIPLPECLLLPEMLDGHSRFQGALKRPQIPDGTNTVDEISHVQCCLIILVMQIQNVSYSRLFTHHWHISPVKPSRLQQPRLNGPWHVSLQVWHRVWHSPSGHASCMHLWTLTPDSPRACLNPIVRTMWRGKERRTDINHHTSDPLSLL